MILKPIIPVVEYVVNYDYIVKELCVNKAKPEMKCNGKCHLMKELAKASDTDNPASQDKKGSHHESEILFLEKETSVVVFNFNSPIHKEINANYSNLYSHQISIAVFHPPTV